MPMHYVTLGPRPIDAAGNVIDKCNPITTVSDVIGSRGTEIRITPTPDVPNSEGYPNIKTFLELEEADGYRAVEINQTFIVLYQDPRSYNNIITGTTGTTNFVSIDQNDMLYLDGGLIFSAASMTDQGSLAANQQWFKTRFIGLAANSVSTPNTTINVATSSIINYQLSTASALATGSLIGVAENGGGTAVLSDRIAPAAGLSAAIGRIYEGSGLSTSTYKVIFTSTILYGGPQ